MEIKVCIGDYCHLKGAEVVVKTFQELLKQHNLDRELNLKGCFCMRRCREDGVSVLVGDEFYKVDYEKVEEFFHTVIKPSSS